MATAAETLQATLSGTEYGALRVLAESTDALSGRRVASELDVSPTTANSALRTLAEAGFATSQKSGRATLWRLDVTHPSICDWLVEVKQPTPMPASASSPYSTGGGGVRLEHSYAACLLAGMLAGEALPELGDSIRVDSIRLQANDVGEVDDILVEGRDSHREMHRASIAVRRSPTLTRSDSASVPLFRDFLTVVIEQWSTVAAGQWRLVLAVSSNANAITQLSELAELARSIPSGAELERRMAQQGRTSASIRDRYNHVKELVKQAAEGLTSAAGLTVVELTWRVLSSLVVRSLRLERTDRVDRTTAVNTLQRVIRGGTPATADALFSRIEELAGIWAPQGAVLTQPLIRRNLSDYPLSRTPTFTKAWAIIDRLGVRLRDSIRPTLGTGTQALELERQSERSRLDPAMRNAGTGPGALVVTGDPDVGKSALTLRVAEGLRVDGGAVTSLSLRDLPSSLPEFENQLGGFGVDEVLGASESQSIRLLVIDGAESALEGKASILRVVATEALKAGIGVVAVTRTDGLRQVRDVLSRSCESAGVAADPAEHVVAPLSENERDRLTMTFPALARLRGDSRSDWLLARPGLVDVLLRTGETLEPASLLCEADVFRAVWRSLIRRDEIHTAAAASPDDREHAALSLAKRTLGLPREPASGTAFAELRSDGVLRTPNDPALSPGGEFSTDLFRDFALCRLFITEGWQVLSAAGAPRWSIRATRLGCQAALLAGTTSTAWAVLAGQFAEIAQSHGGRWSEVPFEALLTLGDAEQAIRDVWDTLTADHGSSLATLVRLAEARYVDGTVGDPFVLAPLVKVVFCDRALAIDGPRLGHRTVHEVVRDIVLAWLRGMATSRPQPDRLRQEVRDTILATNPPSHDDFSVEALATLGPDLDDRAEAWLRGVAEERPGRLSPAVESLVVALSMARTRPQLLLDLAGAYYIELPGPRNRWGGSRLLSDGIRDFKHGLGPGFGVPAAAWYYGPFYRLLNARPIEAIGFINRMLDHAAGFKLQNSSRASNELKGVHLDLPRLGERLYVGDDHVWAWYRGTSVGPYPCMSALLALERFIDDLHERLEVPAQRIVELLLADCNNLAVPGLVVGFLTRHPKSTGSLLDPFLACPAAWHLETARVTSDYGFRMRDPDTDYLTGSDRRRYTFQETVGEMVVSAQLAGDEERLTALRSVGEKLIASARAELAGAHGGDEYLAVIESWAAEFRIENYRSTSDGDRLLIQFERPEPIERVLAPRNAELHRTSVLYGLQHRYGHSNPNPSEWPTDKLGEDLATARQIAESSDALQGALWPENGFVPVAAAAIRSHALGLVAIDESDLRWAIEATLRAAESPQIDTSSHHDSVYPAGADRAAAGALPLLLLAPFDSLNLERERIDHALRALSTSLFDEVRAIYVKGCEPLWEAPCEPGPVDGVCRRHATAWSAAAEGLRDCRLGPWNQETQHREPDPLPPPFDEILPTVADDALLVNRLRMPLSCMVDARSAPCLQGRVTNLWTPLWDAYRRGVAHWWAEGYDHRAQPDHEPIAQRMIEIALNGDRQLVKDYTETLAVNSNALCLLFGGFATVFTYDDRLRQSMAEFWPWALETALDVIGDGADLRSEHQWFDYMVATLLPTPSPHSWDPDIEGTLARSRKNWIQPEELAGLADRWLRFARWEPKAVDAVVKFSRSAPRTWQASAALDWIETIIDDRYYLVSNRLYHMEEWLSELRNAGLVVGKTKDQYQRIVDGLAAAGDWAAVRLQQLDE